MPTVCVPASLKLTRTGQTASRRRCFPDGKHICDRHTFVSARKKDAETCACAGSARRSPGPFSPDGCRRARAARSAPYSAQDDTVTDFRIWVWWSAHHDDASCASFPVQPESGRPSRFIVFPETDLLFGC